MWAAWAAGACVTSASYILLYRYAGEIYNTSSHASMISFVLSSFVIMGALALASLAVWCGCSGGAAVWAECARALSGRLAGILVGVAVLVILTQIGIMTSVVRSPNPGYAYIIINANVLLVLLGAWLFFHLRVTIMSGIGVAVALIGIVLVICGQKKQAR